MLTGRLSIGNVYNGIMEWWNNGIEDWKKGTME